MKQGKVNGLKAGRCSFPIAYAPVMSNNCIYDVVMLVNLSSFWLLGPLRIMKWYRAGLSSHTHTPPDRLLRSTHLGGGATSASLLAHRNLFWQLLAKDGNLHGSGMSRATTSSPEPSFKARWRVVDAMVGRGNAAWTTSKSGHPCLCWNCS